MDCSMTYEHLTFTDQKLCAIRGTNQPFMSLRGIISRNTVPAVLIDGENAIINILDSTFTLSGSGTNPSTPAAITCEGYLVLKNVSVDGYSMMLAKPATKKNGEATAVVEPIALPGKGANAGKRTVAFFTSRPVTRVHPGPDGVPNLPVKETPTATPSGTVATDVPPVEQPPGNPYCRFCP